MSHSLASCSDIFVYTSDCKAVILSSRTAHWSWWVYFVWTGAVWFVLGIFHHRKRWGTVGHHFGETGVPLRARSLLTSLSVFLDLCFVLSLM